MVELAGGYLAIGANHDQHAWATESQLVQARQNLHFLIGIFSGRLQDAGQAIDECRVDFRLWNIFGITLDLP